ncbi:phosphoribosyl-ATP pyrophosphohydrolase [Sporothrix schenckii 1099-18]|uniref:Histidine biosynthesis trifunctional protein n=2 Tax=Sporothrix schenckii TaxID=29908 RepID=U7PLZ0_SPOS1|nr:phosphoribosyl-ATP pyrophosphohydrolase [Sporothrix schenckii 1099-18]ERS96668.1 histidinol dehydrogenase [Sporothrix schenckii ATCC 58251]KJR81359.1 phosphoribosyl-ATP pyrophosphohydrolase [Sporothrix schenckii 1099-18]
MESTLPLPFVVSVPAALDSVSEGLTPAEIAVLGTIFLQANPANLSQLQALLAARGAELVPFVDGTALTSPDDVVALLDLGARRVFVQPSQLAELAPTYGARVAAAVSATDASAASLASATTAEQGGLLVTDLDVAASTSSAFIEAAAATKTNPSLFVQPAPASVATPTAVSTFAESAARIHAIPILPSTALTTVTDSQDKVSVAGLLEAAWQSDRPDKLVTTVVTDQSGAALGLVYSSVASVAEALRTQTGVYQSRKRGLWHKGATSGDTQTLLRIGLDCDRDALHFVVRQEGRRFCHLDQFGCFGDLQGVARLDQTLRARKASAPAGSYTARLFSDEKLLRAKIMEEAEELCDAKTQQEVAFEAADLIYFALVKATAAGVSLADIERSLDAKGLKVQRRPGNAKPKWEEKVTEKAAAAPAAAVAVAKPSVDDRIAMKRIDASKVSAADIDEALRRPSQKSSEAIMKIVTPIIDDVRANGDKALLSYTHKFEKATSLTSPVLKAPFPPELMQLSDETRAAIDLSFNNIRTFHAAQKEDKPLSVETMPGVVCSRFARPIARVGLYVPGGTAVLPSTALMLGVPAMVAGCSTIVLASPPRADGTITPEIVYVAHKVGAESIVLAGGAQAVAAMAYGTESVSKVDKILGPGNQFVTAAKMLVSNDTNAGVGIDMPAGPSEVLVVADAEANPAFVASDLLSQAEHGVDSQVVLLAVDLSEAQLAAIEAEVHSQAMALPRVDIVRGAIGHSVTVQVPNLDVAMAVSNAYAPEHLILQVRDAPALVPKVLNAGSVFVGAWTPESVGDYSAGVNHSLPTYGFAKQYSGVNLGSFVKHITSSNLTVEGLRNVGGAVMQLAKVEELEAHRRAVSIRLASLEK